MPTVTNKTRAPLTVPLPRGKTLHLGPGKTGQVAPAALEHAGVRKLVEAGSIEVVDDGTQSLGPTRGSGKGRGPAEAHVSGSRVRSSGDR